MGPEPRHLGPNPRHLGPDTRHLGPVTSHLELDFEGNMSTNNSSLDDLGEICHYMFGFALNQPIKVTVMSLFIDLVIKRMAVLD